MWGGIKKSRLPPEQGAHSGARSHGPWDQNISQRQRLNLTKPPRRPSVEVFNKLPVYSDAAGLWIIL